MIEWGFVVYGASEMFELVKEVLLANYAALKLVSAYYQAMVDKHGEFSYPAGKALGKKRGLENEIKRLEKIIERAPVEFPDDILCTCTCKTKAEIVEKKEEMFGKAPLNVRDMLEVWRALSDEHTIQRCQMCLGDVQELLCSGKI